MFSDFLVSRACFSFLDILNQTSSMAANKSVESNASASSFSVNSGRSNASTDSDKVMKTQPKMMSQSSYQRMASVEYTRPFSLYIYPIITGNHCIQTTSKPILCTAYSSKQKNVYENFLNNAVSAKTVVVNSDVRHMPRPPVKPKKR